MLRRIVEQPDIVATVRSNFSFMGSSLSGVITLFSLRTLLRSRQHRMILSLYAGVGLTIVLGFLHTRFAKLTPSLSGLSTTFLLSSILAVTLTVLALRVVIAIPITLRANWIFRATQIRPVYAYHHAVRRSLLWLGVVPVVAAFTGGFLAHASWLKVAEHLVVLALFGWVLVELCLFSFRKISFACSYLPGKGHLNFVFWAVLLLAMSTLTTAVNMEGEWLGSNLSFVLLAASLVALIVVLQRVSSMQAQRAEQIVYEDEAMPEMIKLSLNR
jgi:hypothetical protein